jgi:isovaleryl-CoA dehydrogenase
MNDLYDPTEDHRALRDLVRRFAEREAAPQAEAHDRAETFNAELFRQAGALGLLGLLGPESAGGTAMDAAATVILHEELAWADPGFALAVLSHAVLFVNGLARSSAAEAHRAVLAAACAGEIVGAVAMSEPEAGTDVLAMRCKAHREGDDYVIDGTKMWITNGAPDGRSLADHVLVYARTSEAGPRSLSLFLAPKEAPGFALARPVKGKLGMRAATCAELQFTACRIPAGNLIGSEGGAIMHMLRTLEIERVALAAIGCGIGLRALEIMNAYASERRVEGRPIREFGQIQHHIAETYAEVMAARALVYATARTLDLSRPGPGLGADAAKLIAAAAAQAAANRAIQVLGGNGYVADYVVERLWRDARLLSIGGGSNEALQKNITRNLARLGGRAS